MIVPYKFNNLFNRKVKRLCLFAGIVLMGAIFMMLFPQFLAQSDQFITSHAWQLRIMRWTLLIAFVVMWNPLLRFLQSYKILPIDSYHFWKSKKFYIVFWLIIFEILICENVLFKLVEAI